MRRASATTTDSGVSTRRTEVSGEVRTARTSPSSACSRSTASKTRSLGIGTPAIRPSTGRSERTTRRSAGKTRFMYQPSASGSASSRSVSAVGRAVDDHDVPAVGAHLVAELEEGEDLLGPGQHGQLLGLDPVDTDGVEDVEEVVLDLAPGALEAQPRVDLLRVEPGRDLGRLRSRAAGHRRVRHPGRHRGSAPRRWTARASSGRGAPRARPSRRRRSSCRRRPCR